MPLVKAVDRAVARIPPVLAETIGALSVFGLAAALIAGAALVLPSRGEDYEWTQYLILGTIFPTLLLAETLLIRAGKAPPRILALIASALFATFLAAFLWLAGQAPSSLPLLAALLQTAIYLVLRRRQSRKELLLRASALVPFLVLCWMLFPRLLCWEYQQPTDSTFRAVLFLPTLLLAAFVIHGGFEIAPARWSRFSVLARHVATGVALLVLGSVSFRCSELFTVGAYHHWGVIVGPAQLVREGGWLLWDVPSQYGFLNTLAVAFLPTGTVWSSLYYLNGAMTFVLSALLFFLLRSWRAGIAGTVLAFLTVFAGVFLLPGWGKDLAGIETFPSVGAFRFLWCHLLVILLLWRWKKGADVSRVFRAGTVIWLIGCLWSSESLVYCSAIWLPSTAILLMQKYRRTTQLTRRDRIVGAAREGILPVALLAALVIGIALYYRAYLRHFPDFYAYFEYSLAFKNGFFAMAIAPTGSVWVLVLLLCLVAATGTRCLRIGNDRPLPVLCAAWMLLWVTSSYFVSRSHENNATNLCPVFLTVAGTVLLVARQALRESFTAEILASAFTALFCTLIVGAYGNRELDARYLTYFQGLTGNVERRLPRWNDDMKKLAASVGIGPGAPLVFIDPTTWENLPPAMIIEGSADPIPFRPWLPVAPAALLSPISSERRDVYLTRFLDRRRERGWLMMPKAKSSAREIQALDNWLNQLPLDLAHHGYRIEKVRSTQDWTFLRCEPK